VSSDKANYRTIGGIGLGIGGALIVLAILVLFTNIQIHRSIDLFGNVTSMSIEFPNYPYSIGLAVVGIIFAAIGSASRMEAKRQVRPPFTRTPPPPDATFCPYCGMQNTPNSVFCSKCGKKLT
jgi:uncharacterized integral membrane protein